MTAQWAIPAITSSVMIKIEEVVDDNDLSAQTRPAAGQEDTVEPSHESRQAAAPAQQSTDATGSEHPAEETEQGNSEEDLQVCTSHQAC